MTEKAVFEKYLDLNNGHDGVNVTAARGSCEYDARIYLGFAGRDPTTIRIRFTVEDMKALIGTLTAAVDALETAAKS